MPTVTETGTAGPSVGRVLDDATARLVRAGIDGARLDAEVMLAAACDRSRTALYVHRDDALSRVCRARFEAGLARRVAGEPVSYVIGWREFWSLAFEVSSAVLIPRPETELLVEMALAVPQIGHTICDVGTGSGCVAVALARELPLAEIWAVDASPQALAIAARNADRHGVRPRIHFAESDLFSLFPDRRFDLIVANPPYVSRAALAAAQPELAWEPRLALDGGDSGLDVITRLLAAAPAHLVDGGWLLMELGADQAVAVERLARAAGLAAIEIRRDYEGRPRVLCARR